MMVSVIQVPGRRRSTPGRLANWFKVGIDDGNLDVGHQGAIGKSCERGSDQDEVSKWGRRRTRMACALWSGTNAPAPASAD